MWDVFAPQIRKQAAQAADRYNNSLTTYHGPLEWVEGLPSILTKSLPTWTVACNVATKLSLKFAFHFCYLSK